MMETLWIGLCASAIGVAFAGVQPGLFSWWFNLLLWIEPFAIKFNIGLKAYQFDVGVWITKPLGLCPQCFAGQVALWWAIIAKGPTWGAIVSASIAIVITPGLYKAYEWSRS